MKLDMGWALRSDVHGRIAFHKVCGIKGNDFVDITIPGAKVAISFVDRGLKDFYEELYYFPEEDKFYAKSVLDSNPLQGWRLMEDYDEENKKIVKGRLAAVTGIVAEEPLTKGEVYYKTAKLTDWSISEEMEKLFGNKT